MTEALLKNTETSLRDVDVIAVAQGPGSFTGIRIGVSTVKGLCWGADKPAVGVSTLEAMAWNGLCAPENAIICPAMDARRGQLYNALFTIEDGHPVRQCPDRAIAAAELAQELGGETRPAFVLGDGAELCAAALEAAGVRTLLAPEPVRRQNAWGVAMAAPYHEPESAETLLPSYLRLSQAERERQAAMEKEKQGE